MVVSNNNFTKVDQYQNLFQKSRAIPKQIKFNFLTKKLSPDLKGVNQSTTSTVYLDVKYFFFINNREKKVNNFLFTFAYQTAEGLATKAMAAAACG